ncbi:hypothetical protein LSTR_LSTR005636 [Laodelphax striatellus]|uniref:Exonuclease domain-containing protein n=1 Tax=Laodelphax striatellus TaxID=195883 RepID=A0A482WUW9_LAOST|nr:hypothetical protein LSTR_LSTR005636 [Laodelphax striatellus]
MLPSKGYFKALSCPFHHEGLCKRSYCHFRHSRKDGQSLTELPIFTNGTSKQSLSADSNTGTHFEKSAMGRDNEEQPCSENVLPSRSGELVIETPSTTAPSYKPTPISELQKRHIPVTFNPDSERIRSKTHVRKKAKIEYVPKSIGGKVPVADYKPTPSNSSIESKFLNAVKSTPSSPSSQDFTPSSVKKMDLIIKNPNLMPSEIPSSSSSLNSSFDSSDELTSSQELNMDLIVKNPHMTPMALGITSKDDVLDDYIAKEIDLLGEILAADGVGSVFESLEADYNAKYEQSDNSSEVSRVDDYGADDNMTDDDYEILPADVRNSDFDNDRDQEERIPGPIKTDSLESYRNFTETLQESEKSRTKSDGKSDNSSNSTSTTTNEDNKHSKSSKHSNSSKHRSDKHSDSQKRGLTNSDQKKQNGSEMKVEKVGDKQTGSSHYSKHKNSSSKSSDKSHSSSSKHGSSRSSKTSDRSHKFHGSSNKHGSSTSKSSDRSHNTSNKHAHALSSHKDEKSHKHSRKDEGIKDDKISKKDESSKDDKSVEHSKKDGSSKDDRSVKHPKKDEPSKHEKSNKLSKKDESSKDYRPEKCSKKDGSSKENKSDKHSKKDDSSKNENSDKDSKKYKSSRDDKTDRHSHDRKDESKTSRKSSHSSKDKNSEKSSHSDSKKDESHKKDSRDGKSRKHSHSDTVSDSNSKDCKKSRTDKYSSNNNENVTENREKDSLRKRKHSPEKNHHSSSRNSKKSKRDKKYHYHDKSLPKSHTQSDDLYHSDHSSDVEEIVQPVITISIDSSSDESADDSPQSSVKSSPAREMEYSDNDSEPPQLQPEPTIEPHLEIPTVKTKVRTAHNVYIRTMYIRPSSSPSMRNARKSLTPSEILLKRYSGTAATAASTSAPASSPASSADILAHPAGQRVRIAHVPNVNSLLDSRKQLLKGAPAQNSNKPPRPSGVPREAIACSGPPTKFQKEPLPIVANIPNCAIPLVKRQNFLSSIYDSYCQIYDFKTAKEKALRAEEEIAKNSTKTTYRDKVANLCIGLKRDAALLSGNVSYIENSPTIEEDPLIPAYTYGKPLYECFLKYVVTNPYEEGIPVEHETEPGCARMKLLYNENKCSYNKPHNICINCGKTFTVDNNNFSIERNCQYHRDRKQQSIAMGSRYHERYWACCGQNKPCVVSEYHIRDNINYDMMPGFVKTPPCPADLKFPGIYALDCEMCYTTHDHELTRVTVVNHEREVVYESYCKPLFPIIDYCTRFSGVEEKHLVNVTTTLNEIQEDLLKMFNEKTILIGHSIGSDLKALKILHKNVVDTSCVFLRPNGFRQKLRDIAQEFLKRPIQEGVNGHCSEEDAMASLDLMIYKIKEDCKACKPRTIISLA